MKWKSVLLASAAGLLLSLAAAQPAGADHRDDQRKCFDKVRKEQDKLERDIRKHGWNSRQAQQRRQKVQRLRSQCGDNGWGWGRNDRRDDGWFGRDNDRNRRRDGDWRDDDRNRRNRDWRNDDRNRRDRDNRDRNRRNFWEWWRDRR